jgi:hypothetical protein
MTEFESEMLSESRKQTVILAEIANNLKAIYERDIRIAKKRPKTSETALENSNNSALSLLQKDTVLYAKFTFTISYYPDFSKDYIKLNDFAFIKGEGCLIWHLSKQALAEYFGNQRKSRMQVQKWELIENLFMIKNRKGIKPVTDLKNSFSNNGNAFRNERSEDYEKILKLLGTPRSK